MFASIASVQLPPEIAPDRAWEDPEEDDAAASNASDQEEEEHLEAPSLDEQQVPHNSTSAEFLSAAACYLPSP